MDGIETLSRLRTLSLRGNGLTDLSPIAGLTSLIDLDVACNPISGTDLEEFYAPKEEDYFTDTRYGSIHDSLPQFRFDRRMYLNKKTSDYSVDTLTVSDRETGETIQTISIPELSYFGATHISIYDEDKGFSLEDVNFDGYLDIRLFDTYNGNYLIEWIYLVWDPQACRFVPDPQLNEISLAVFDQEKQLIYGMERSSAAEHSYYTYQYINGGPTLIASEILSE